MRRKKPMVGKPIAFDDDVVSIVVTNDGAVRIVESATDDANYGRRLAARISRSLRKSEDSRILEQDAFSPKGWRAPSSWTNYKQMLHSATPRFEQSRPREFNVGSCMQCLPGRKEPKRGC